MSKGEYDYNIAIIIKTAKEIVALENKIHELQQVNLDIGYHVNKLQKSNQKIFAIKEKIWNNIQKQNL